MSFELVFLSLPICSYSHLSTLCKRAKTQSVWNKFKLGKNAYKVCSLFTVVLLSKDPHTWRQLRCVVIYRAENYLYTKFKNKWEKKWREKQTTTSQITRCVYMCMLFNALLTACRLLHWSKWDEIPNINIQFNRWEYQQNWKFEPTKTSSEIGITNTIISIPKISENVYRASIQIPKKFLLRKCSIALIFSVIHLSSN